MKTGCSILILLYFSSFWNGCNRTTYTGLPDYEQMSAAEIDNLIETGLKAWRTPGAIDTGASCASCHAPDALDLAYIHFDDFHIRRRGARHVDKEIGKLNASQLEDIISMIHATRIKFGIIPEDSRIFRPFQPGSGFLEGESIQERDIAFGRYLKQAKYRFATIPVLGREEAHLQKQEWLGIDLYAIPAGIALPRWSEDPYYGEESTTLADWLPALPFIPRHMDAGRWYHLHDEYMRNAVDQNLTNILDGIGELTVIPFDGNGAELMLLKYQSSLIAQHLFRKGLSGNNMKVLFPQHPAKKTENGDNRTNPLWSIGEFFYKNSLQNNLELPQLLESRYFLNTDNPGQMQEMALSWYWLGWMADPGFHQTICSIEEHCSLPLSNLLVKQSGPENGYDLHHTFMIAKMNAEALYGEQDPVGYSVAGRYETLYFGEFEPHRVVESSSVHRLNTLITENSFRMFFFLFLDEYETNTVMLSGQLKKALQDAADTFESFINQTQSEHNGVNRELIERVRTVCR